MTATTHAKIPSIDAEALEIKRVKFFKIFMVLSAINNTILAIFALGFKGGALFEKLAAPQWSALALGILGVVSIAFSIGGLLWKKWGLIGLIAAALGAVVVSAMIKLWAAAGTFAFAALVLVAFARHLWARFE